MTDIPKSTTDKVLTNVTKDPETGCWNSNYTPGRKYPSVKVCGQNVYVGAHRIAAIAAHGEPLEEGLCAMHACDNPRCVNPDHLSWGTYADNSADMVNKGRAQPWNKVSDERVREFKRRLDAGESRFDLAEEYGMHPMATYKMLKRLKD